MSVGRRGPLSFLDTEWRTALWKRWVATHLVPEAGVPADHASGAHGTADTPKPTNGALDDVANLNGTGEHFDALRDPRRGETTRAHTPSNRPEPTRRHLDEKRRSERTADVRARFDAITDRLQGLEDAIDVIARRLSHRTRRERRTDRRTAELVESIAETVDAQAAAIDSLASTLERIERRLDRNERPREEERRDSRVPKARSSEPPRNGQGSRADETGEFAPVRFDGEDADTALSGNSIRGSIGDMSLSTVLAMLEIERRSGRLKVQNEDGSIAAFELEDGSVVNTRVSENDVDPVESLREVLTWKNGRFWFRQNPSESLVSPPRSVNSLLLEATRQLDEAVRAG